MKISTHHDIDVRSLERDRDVRGLIRVIADLGGQAHPSEETTVTLWRADDALKRVVQRMGDAAVAPLAKELRHRGPRAEIAAEVMWLTGSRVAIAHLERSAYSPFRSSRFTLRASQSLRKLRSLFSDGATTSAAGRVRPRRPSGRDGGDAPGGGESA